MTKSLLVLAFCLISLSSVIAEEAPSKLNPESLAGQRVMVLGDSVTQDGRYLSFIEYFLQKQNPDLDFDIVNAGLASETTSGLTEEGHPGPRPCIHERLDRALADVKPQLVIACYGMNDGIYKPLDAERERAFHEGVTRLVEECRKVSAKIILVTPPAYDVECHGGLATMKFDYNSVLDAYSEWELKTPPVGASVINTHQAVSQQIKSCRDAGHPMHNNGDGVHPTEMGHYVIARAIMQELGMKLPEGDLAQQLAQVQADPLYSLVRQRQSARGQGWLNYIGFTRVNQTTEPHQNNIEAVEAQAATQMRVINQMRRRGG